MKLLINNKGRTRLLFLIIFLIIIVTCIILLSGKGPQDTAKRNLKEVLKIILVFPDEGTDYFYKITDSKQNESYDEAKGIGESKREAINPFFSGEGAENTMGHWYRFGAFCAGTDWSTEVQNIKIEYDKGSERMLLFHADILCKSKESEESVLKVEGRAQYDEKGKLSYWRLSDNSIEDINKLNEELQIDTGIN